MNLNLFGILSCEGSVTGTQLTQMTGADHVLLMRILRYLAALHLMIQIENDRYVKNEITERLADPTFAASFNFTFDYKSAAYMALPGFLESSGYQNPQSLRDCAFQRGHGTEATCLDRLQSHPSADLEHFNEAVNQQQEEGSWLSFYPLRTRFTLGFNLFEHEVLLVDMRGGRGQECQAIRARHAILPGRMVLQDSAEKVARALPVEGMDVMVHDIFRPQPIRGIRSLSVHVVGS